MDIKVMMQMIDAQSIQEQRLQGQCDIRQMLTMLKNVDKDTPCKYDTGHNFGNSEVTFSKEEGLPEHGIDDHEIASSDTAYPSCYRGFYRDLTLNASLDFPESTVGHVVSLLESAIGKTFDGYKGGTNEMTESTLVWGAGASHSTTLDSAMVVGMEIRNGCCVILTKEYNDGF